LSGRVKFDPKRGSNGRYEVWFYNPDSKRTDVLRRNTDGTFLETEAMANRLLSIIQGDYERRNTVPFKLSKYKSKTKSKSKSGQGITDFINLYIEKGADHMAPGGSSSAISRLRTWVIPFFEPMGILLHEISTEKLLQLAISIPRAHKTRKNVLYDFKACLDYAVITGKLKACPQMPKQKFYKKKGDITPEEKTIETIPRWKQFQILAAIPVVDQPLFVWLMTHPGRRPAEAYALHKESYNAVTDSFEISYNISDRELVEKPKNGRFIAACSDHFRPLLARCLATPGPYMFYNPRARRDGKRYSDDTANRIWTAACKKIGFTKIEKGKQVAAISLYNGVKHSTMDYFLNDLGLNQFDLMGLTGHKSLKSIHHYARVNLQKQARLLSMDVIDPELQRILDAAANYKAGNSHQVGTKESVDDV
jgi:hypothetical protein